MCEVLGWQCELVIAVGALLAIVVSVFAVVAAARAARFAAWALLLDAVPILWPSPQGMSEGDHEPKVSVEIVNAGKVPAVLVQAWLERRGAKPPSVPDHDSYAVIEPGDKQILHLPVHKSAEVWEELKPCSFVVRYVAPSGATVRLIREETADGESRVDFERLVVPKWRLRFLPGQLRRRRERWDTLNLEQTLRF
jgi:hypothetical protein